MSETLPTTPSPSSSLLMLSDADLGKRIDAHHSGIHDIESKARQNIIGEALKVGELLIEAKRRVGHGNFGTWLKKHCVVPERTAQRYMKIKEEWPKIEAWLRTNNRHVADLSLREAEKLLAPPPIETKDDVKPKVVDEVVVNDPLAGIRQLENDLVVELKTLKRDNEAKAKEAAANIVRRLEDADLY